VGGTSLSRSWVSWTCPPILYPISPRPSKTGCSAISGPLWSCSLLWGAACGLPIARRSQVTPRLTLRRTAYECSCQTCTG
jgi:hypothetical protein